MWQVQDDMVCAAAGISQPASASKNIKVMKIASKPLLCIQETIWLLGFRQEDQRRAVDPMNIKCYFV